jgi:hypothetical protein
MAAMIEELIAGDAQAAKDAQRRELLEVMETD